jgi:hypothetical protein
MERFNETTLSIEQQESQKKFEKLLPVVDLIKSKFNSDIADSFIEQMNNKRISFDYDLARNFLSYVSSDIEEEFQPAWTDSEYDKDNQQIESIIISLAKDLQEEAE